MSNLKKRYQNISNEKLIEAYTLISDYTEEAKKIIIEEIKHRNIDVSDIENNEADIEDEEHVQKRNKSLEIWFIIPVLIILSLGVQGLVFGFIVSKFFGYKGYDTISNQILSWTMTILIIKVLYAIFKYWYFS